MLFKNNKSVTNLLFGNPAPLVPPEDSWTSLKPALWPRVLPVSVVRVGGPAAPRESHWLPLHGLSLGVLCLRLREQLCVSHLHPG